MFSNLGEYQGFLETNCERCKRYISWEDDPSGVCPIEDALSNCSITGEGFPKDKVALNEHGCWECKGFEGEEDTQNIGKKECCEQGEEQ